MFERDFLDFDDASVKGSIDGSIDGSLDPEDHLEMSVDKKKRRLEKNREAARASRRRKRDHVDVIEKTLEEVEEANARLRLEVKLGEEAAAKEEDDTARFCQDLESMINTHAADDALVETLKTYQEKHADYGKDRRSAVK
jgi:hypothetical protein